MVIFYKNSFLASAVSIFGCVMFMGGIAVIAEGEIGGGILMMAIGVALLIWARNISDNKAFKKWWKQITDANLETEIAKSAYIAMEIYNKNPQKRTLDKIAQLNPSAAEMIQRQLDAQKAKK